MESSEKLKNSVRQKIDSKTKPLGALGQLESLAEKICLVQGTTSPALHKPRMLVFAADHGIAESGVSAYPPEVTYQMVLNFLQGGAAINVFCKQHGLDLQIVDVGVRQDFAPGAKLLKAKAGKGSRNFLEAPALTPDQLAHCFAVGKERVEEAASEGCNVIGFGEMGIGNTSAAACLMHSLTDIPLEACVGKGTGVDAEGYQRKLAILQQAVGFHRLANPSAEEVLLTFGGFEIAAICSAMVTAAKHNMLILLDGFIAGAAYLCAQKLCPELNHFTIATHLSEEQGHQKLLHHLGLRPILRLNMRLGEGTGCALAYPLVQSAVSFMNEMASFSDAKVSNRQ